MEGISRRTWIFGLLTAAAGILAGPARAASGPTLLPRRVGQTVIWRGRKYTAIKSGKKLVWDKGVALPVAQPSATPTPSASRTVKSQMGEIVLASTSAVAMGESKIIGYKDLLGVTKNYVVTRASDGLRAFDTTCTHEGCAVELAANQLACFCHLSYFDRMSGEALSGPARKPLLSYPARESNGQILVTDKIYSLV
ncbi:MAG: Rieske (2Fe-2S) protein [Actinobacteria bacterium]|nr:Rieske (2Fe-2S) protein [Actinomycetota bacterium]